MLFLCGLEVIFIITIFSKQKILFHVLKLPQNDPMNDPTYHLQGEPDEDSQDTYRCTNDDVWIPRDEDTAASHVSQYDDGELLYRETVLLGAQLRSPNQRKAIQQETVPKTVEQVDHYDVIDGLYSFIHSFIHLF